jgi:Transposase
MTGLGDVGAVAELGRQFVQIIRERRAEELDRWIECTEGSSEPELQRFAVGLKRDDAAVRAALEEPWSNGPVEGQSPSAEADQAADVRARQARSAIVMLLLETNDFSLGCF